jgi:spore germination protein GerM
VTRRHLLIGIPLLVALAAGCGIPTDSSPRPLEDVPFGLGVPPSTVPADEPTPSGSTYSAKLYFVSATRLVGVDVDLPLAATPQDQARVVLEALASGPRENLPMRTALRPSTQMNVTLRGSLATVELDQSVLDVVPDEQLFAIGQIVLSLTRVSPIVDVQFTANGQPVLVFLPGLSVADGPVKASDYLPLLTS